MVGNGANAGNLSPLSAVGLIVRGLMEQAGLPGHEAAVFLANFTAHFLVSLAAYFLMGGYRIHGRLEEKNEGEVHLEVKQKMTLLVLCLWALGVLLGMFPPGLSSLAAVALLFLLQAEEEIPVFRSVPWSVILMVCGVSTLVGILEKTGGLNLFTSLLAGITSPAWVNGTMAFVAGLISTYSSTSGVVYPAFLPTVPGLVERLGGGNPLEIALSINVGAALVDVSPLSTVGALCMAALPPGQDSRKLFRQLLVWGFSMVVVGALFCQFGIRYFAR
jgi:di/tricarboxylate transporter